MKCSILMITVMSFFPVAGLYANSFPSPEWDIAPYVSHIDYREPGVMSQDGVMWGLMGRFAYHDDFMIKLEGYGAGGTVDYKGGTWEGGSLRINNIPDYMLEGRLVGGWDFSLSPQFRLTPFSVSDIAT